MSTYSLTHLSDAVLLRDVATLIARDRSITASMLAHLAEFDERRLFAGAGYPSMHAYCVEELRMSDEAAYLRINAARTARRFPVLFEEVADGRLNLTGVRLLAPHLTAENCGELVVATRNLRRFEIEELLARRFSPVAVAPRSQVIRAIPTPSVRKLGLNQVDDLFRSPPAATDEAAPPGEERFDLRFSIGKISHDRLRHAQRILSHAIPSGDLEQIFDRALIALIAEVEKQKFAATEKPRKPRPSRSKRHVPAHVKRAVWKRDGGRCTFVSDSGRRCAASGRLEYDHIDPVALGGKATVERVRLRCRGHNQLEAERVFGAEFMREKRAQAAAARAP